MTINRLDLTQNPVQLPTSLPPLEVVERQGEWLPSGLRKHLIARRIIPEQAPSEDPKLTNYFLKFFKDIIAETRTVPSNDLKAVIRLAEQHIKQRLEDSAVKDIPKEVATLERYIFTTRLRLNDFESAEQREALREVAKQHSLKLFNKWERLNYQNTPADYNAFWLNPDLIDLIFDLELSRSIRNQKHKIVVWPTLKKKEGRWVVEREAHLKMNGQLAPWSQIRDKLHVDHNQQLYTMEEDGGKSYWSYSREGLIACEPLENTYSQLQKRLKSLPPELLCLYVKGLTPAERKMLVKVIHEQDGYKKLDKVGRTILKKIDQLQDVSIHPTQEDGSRSPLWRVIRQIRLAIDAAPYHLTGYLTARKTCASLEEFIFSKTSKESAAPPTHFGIGSCFPGSTSLTPIVSFGLLSSLYNSVSVTRGMIDESPSHMEKWRSVTESENIQMLPTFHGANTSKWRKELIQAAEHNIVLSGNYCGQHAFDETLELIREKMEEKENLKVVIIASPTFVLDEDDKNIKNQTLIAELQQKYPSRFSVVYSPNIWLFGVEDGYKKSTNHVKYLGIDWGRHYIMGGSAIKNNFSMSGVDNIFEILSEEENAQLAQLQEKLLDLKKEWKKPNSGPVVLSQKNQEWIRLGETVKNTLINSPHFSSMELSPVLEKISSILQLIRVAADLEDPTDFFLKNANQLELELNNQKLHDLRDSGLTGMFVPGNFRDMDFVFSDPNDGYSSGRQLFLEMVRLAYRWEALNSSYENRNDISFFTPSQVAHLPIFTGETAQGSSPTDSVTHRIMREPMPESSRVRTQEVKGFEDAKTGSLQMLYQGPEQMSGTNEFSSKALELIRNAQKRIVFNHMYFSPTDEIREALKEAIEQRGVQVELITCGETRDCPNGQRGFGPYNHWNWVKLAEQLAPEHRQNFRVFLFSQRKKGLHKKVIVVDDQVVLAGSSNFGYKSLVTSSDHEVNFVAKSEDFAQKTLAVCEEDKKLSQEVPDTTQISKIGSFRASFYHKSRSLAN